MTRRLAAFVVAAVATFSATPGANAVTRDEIRLAEDQTVTRDFPAMGPAAGTENETALPAVCEASPTCDLVPLNVILPPDYDDSNDFAVQIRLEWKTQQLPNDQGQANDLDLFLWGLDEEGNDELIARSVGTRVPEIVGIGQPDDGNYKVTVRNSLGNNSGYKLTFRWISGRLTAPIASEEPGPTPSAATEDTGVNVAPPPASGRARPVFESAPSAPSPVGDPIRGPIGDAAVFGDPDFLGPGVSDLDSLLQANPGAAQSLRFRRTQELGPAKAPSGAALLIWLVVVPMILAGAALFWFVRRRPAALSFNLPSAARA